MSQHAVVVGGGVIGASSAYYLAKSGWRVTILERNRFGAGCSHANCGLICPSHVLPLASPGAVWNVLTTMFKPRSPVRLKPRIDFRLWGWLLRFARRCNERDMIEAAAGIHSLSNSSRRLFVDLIREESMDLEWEERGLLFVFKTATAFEHFSKTNDLLSAQFNMPAKKMANEELLAFEPALKPIVAGGWWYSGDAHLRPDRLMSQWKTVLERMGVRIVEDESVTSIAREQKTVKGVRTKRTTHDADAVVITAGAWTPLLEKEIGCHIPIQPGKGYSLTMDRPAICPKTPLIFEEHHVAVTPFQSGYRLGSMMEYNGYDDRMNRDRLDILREGAKVYLQEPLGEPVREEWWGWRPMTTDGNPFIGRVPSCENLWIAAGHSMLGLTQAPATGKLLAELINEQTPHVDPKPYRIGR